jgi:hypothetical protein
MHSFKMLDPAQLVKLETPGCEENIELLELPNPAYTIGQVGG